MERHFEKELNNLKATLEKMARLCEESLQWATKALLEDDKISAEKTFANERIINSLDEVAAQYGLDALGRKGAQALVDVGGAKVVSDFAKPLVEAGAHPLQALMSLHVIFSLSHKARKAEQPAQPAEVKK